MKILLVAVNAKYIHSNPAVYSLKMSAEKAKEGIEIVEYTINHYIDDVIRDIYKKRPDVLCFSCYIWNVEFIKEIINEIKQTLPDVDIWLGGPEVSYYTKDVMESMPQVKGIISGEGEESFADLTKAYVEGRANDNTFKQIYNLTYKDENDNILINEQRHELDLDELPFMYSDLENFKNRIIYYESSRGCPFSCAYCLSADDNKLRFKSLEKVKKELSFFIEKKVPQVKFIDRTFNCKKEHSIEIWKFILENDNGITNFHFEIAADLLNAAELELIKKMRPGLIQFEIGVQSTNKKTLEAINRRTDINLIKEQVLKIKSFKNIHQHLDLIAGLPYEDLESFKNSFDQVYDMCPDQLQLGFLKVLKGTPIYNEILEYEIKYKTKANFEVLKTKWISYDDIIELKEIEEVLELYYNSGQFKNTLKVLEREYESAYQMFFELSGYYHKNSKFEKHSRINNYEIILGFIKENFKDEEKIKIYTELLILDLYLRENMKKRPEFAGEKLYFKDKKIHIEKFGRDIFKLIEQDINDNNPQIYKFDYINKDEFLNEAYVTLYIQ